MAVIPIFFHDAVENGPKSAEAGRPIYDQVECIRLIVPGSRDEVVRRVTDEDRAVTYASDYERFRRRGEAGPSGTPLSEWPAMSVAMLRELEHFNIRSLEDLAAVADSHLGNLPMGIVELRARARAQLDLAADNAVTERLGAENAALKTRLEALQAQVDALTAAASAPVASRGGKGRVDPPA